MLLTEMTEKKFLRNFGFEPEEAPRTGERKGVRVAQGAPLLFNNRIR